MTKISESSPKFDDLLLSQNLTHLGQVFDRLVSKNPETAKKILNSKISEEPDFVKFDFGPFFKSPKLPIPSEPEMPSTILMLSSDREDLIRHPLTETFVRSKWRKVSRFFFAAFVYRLLVAVAVTVAVIFGSKQNKTINEWNAIRSEQLLTTSGDVIAGVDHCPALRSF